MEPDYHGSPIGDGRSLVVRDWGDDIVDFIEAQAGTPTRRYRIHSWRNGIRGEMTDVLVSQSASRIMTLLGGKLREPLPDYGARRRDLEEFSSQFHIA